MSHIANDIYLETMDENFQKAIDAGDYVFAAKVIDELENKNFHSAAAILREVLLDMQISNLIHFRSTYA